MHLATFNKNDSTLSSDRLNYPLRPIATETTEETAHAPVSDITIPLSHRERTITVGGEEVLARLKAQIDPLQQDLDQKSARVLKRRNSEAGNERARLEKKATTAAKSNATKAKKKAEREGSAGSDDQDDQREREHSA